MIQFLGGSKLLVGALVVMAGILQSLGDCGSTTIAVNKTVQGQTATIICTSGCHPLPSIYQQQSDYAGITQAMAVGQPATFQVKGEGFGAGQPCPVRVTWSGSSSAGEKPSNQTLAPPQAATVKKTGSSCTITTNPVPITFNTSTTAVEVDVEIDGQNFVTDHFNGSTVYALLTAGQLSSSSSSSSSSSGGGGGGGAGGGGGGPTGPSVTFGATQTYPTTFHAMGVAALDLWSSGAAADGRAGVVASDDADNAATPDEIQPFKSNSAGSLTQTTPYQVGAGADPRRIAVGDFNGDRRPDFAVSLANTGNTPGHVRVFMNNAMDGSFNMSSDYNVHNEPVGIVAGLFLQSPETDLVTANSASNDVSLLPNSERTPSSPGTFGTALNFPSGGQGTRDVAAGDFNGDGKLDVAVADEVAHVVAVLPNTSTPGPPYTPSFGSAQPLAQYNQTGPAGIAAADFNGDGKPDIAVANAGSANVSVFLNTTATAGTSTPTFGPQVNYATGAEPLAVKVADFNGDGIADLVTANMSGGNASVLLGKGDGTFAPAISVGAGLEPQDVATGDLNGDGKPDLIVANQGDPLASPPTPGSVTVALNQGGTAAAAHAARAKRKSKGPKQTRVVVSGPATIGFKSFGRMFIDPSGNGHVQGAIVKGTLGGRVVVGKGKKFPAIPHALSDILTATFYGKIDATRYIQGRLNPVLVGGTLVARSRRAPRLKACVRVTPHNGSVKYNQVTLLAGTGPLAKITMTALYPPFSIDPQPAKPGGGSQTLLLGKRRKPARMPKSCTALLKQLH